MVERNSAGDAVAETLQYTRRKWVGAACSRVERRRQGAPRCAWLGPSASLRASSRGGRPHMGYLSASCWFENLAGENGLKSWLQLVPVITSAITWAVIGARRIPSRKWPVAA